MLHKLLFGILCLLFVACGSNHSDFAGEWTDKEKENEILKISKVDNNYLVEFGNLNRNEKFPAKVIDNMLEISTGLPVKAIIDDNDNLIVNGKEYIRFEKSKRYPFVGKWKSVYFVNNGETEMPFENKTGVRVYLIINSDLSVNCEFEAVSFHGEKIDVSRKEIDCKDFFGDSVNILSFEKGILRALQSRNGYFTEGYLELSIENDFLKIKSTQDSDFSLFKKE